MKFRATYAATHLFKWHCYNKRMYKIAVLEYRLHRDIQEKIQSIASNKIEFLTERCPENERIARTADADIVLITPWDKVDKTYLDACPRLKYIGLCGTSTANIDRNELTNRGIAFSNIVSGDKEAVGEYFFMQLIRLIRGKGEYQWKTGEVHELVGKNIGIVGLGAVGQAIAHLALAYKMNVFYFSPHRKQEWEDRGVDYLGKKVLLELSEIIVLCSPTNFEVLSYTDFEAMRPGSILIQACGGSPFDTSVFMNWVAQDGNFGIFDMSANENNFQLYREHPKVIFSDEIAGDTYETNDRRGQRALQNLYEFLNK